MSAKAEGVTTIEFANNKVGNGIEYPDVNKDVKNVLAKARPMFESPDFLSIFPLVMHNGQCH